MTVRVAFRTSDTRKLARIIHFWDRSEVSHCEVAVYWDGATHDCISASWLDGGVRLKPILLTPEKWRVYQMPDTFESDLALRWLERHERDGYDWPGLFGFLWRPFKGLSHRWFCSEACAAMLGIEDAWRYSPRALECFVARVGQRVF